MSHTTDIYEWTVPDLTDEADITVVSQAIENIDKTLSSATPLYNMVEQTGTTTALTGVPYDTDYYLGLHLNWGEQTSDIKKQVYRRYMINIWNYISKRKFKEGKEPLYMGPVTAMQYVNNDNVDVLNLLADTETSGQEDDKKVIIGGISALNRTRLQVKGGIETHPYEDTAGHFLAYAKSSNSTSSNVYPDTDKYSSLYPDYLSLWKKKALSMELSDTLEGSEITRPNLHILPTGSTSSRDGIVTIGVNNDVSRTALEVYGPGDFAPYNNRKQGSTDTPTMGHINVYDFTRKDDKYSSYSRGNFAQLYPDRLRLYTNNTYATSHTALTRSRTEDTLTLGNTIDKLRILSSDMTTTRSDLGVYGTAETDILTSHAYIGAISAVIDNTGSLIPSKILETFATGDTPAQMLTALVNALGNITKARYLTSTPVDLDDIYSGGIYYIGSGEKITINNGPETPIQTGIHIPAVLINIQAPSYNRNSEVPNTDESGYGLYTQILCYSTDSTLTDILPSTYKVAVRNVYAGPTGAADTISIERSDWKFLTKPAFTSVSVGSVAAGSTGHATVNTGIALTENCPRIEVFPTSYPFSLGRVHPNNTNNSTWRFYVEFANDDSSKAHDLTFKYRVLTDNM